MRRCICSLLLAASGVVPAEAQITLDERGFLDRLDASRTLAFMQRLSEQVVDNRSGFGAGTGAAGTADEQALADVIEAEMKRIGLVTRQERFPVRVHQAKEVIFSAAGRTLPAVLLHGSPGTWGTRDGVPYNRGTVQNGRVLRASVADAGEGRTADYERAGDVSGKVVLVRRAASLLLSILEAAHRGASAIVFYDYPGENPDEALKQDPVQYHDPIPAFSISKRDAVFLRERLDAGGVTVEIEVQVESRYGLSQNVIGAIEGASLPDEYVMVTAHHDRWHRGAQDDSIGVAVMLELARMLAAGPRPRRTIMFVSFGAEEAGSAVATDSDWLAGSFAFAKAHPEITTRLAYAFNVDGAGWTADKGYLFATPDNLKFQEKLLADLDLGSRVTLRTGVTAWVDAWSLGANGGGAVADLLWFEGHATYRDGTSFSRYYHTQLDVYRPEDYQNLEHDLRLGGLGVLRADRGVNLPISFETVGKWAGEALDADAAKVADVPFEQAWQALKDFQAAASEVENLRHASSDAARAANRWLMKTRSDLMPWLLTTSTQRAVLRTSPYASDLQALRAAHAAAERGDSRAAIAALERAGSVSVARNYSRETYLAERVFDDAPGLWAADYQQNARRVSPEIEGVYRRLAQGGETAREVSRLKEFEAQARGNLVESLYLIAAKLRAAARALRQTPRDESGLRR